MSLTPIFDKTLADAPASLWEASAIFPVPGAETLLAAAWKEFSARHPEGYRFTSEKTLCAEHPTYMVIAPMEAPVTLWSILKPRFMQ